MSSSVKSREAFLELLFTYYAEHGRDDLPWRLAEPDGSYDPYKILVSELMLQQTQVLRVIPKYEAFLARFLTMKALSAAPLGDVLVAWQGLGYNRRAKFLWQAAQKTIQDFGGELPHDQLSLESLPGIGANTAGAIRAYAFNEPAIFIETNVRTVYIHHFFQDHTAVSDTAIAALLSETLDQRNPRIFYWALMDYGSYLKQTVGNLSRASKLYTKQSKFSGSSRQLRGRILALLSSGAMTETGLLAALNDNRTSKIINDLIAEGLVRKQTGRYRLP